MSKKSWEEVDKHVRRGIITDDDLHDFLQSEIKSREEREAYIKHCLKKLVARRMLLRAQWYLEIADGLERIKENRPALRIVFLMSLAEGVVKLKEGNKDISSYDAIRNFFDHTPNTDRDFLKRNFRRTLLGFRHHILYFSSIVKILYDIRNHAVHGDDFYSFSLLDEQRKKEHSHYTHFAVITSAKLGRKGKTRKGNKRRQRRVSLDISMTYEELRDIIRRTALKYILDYLEKKKI